MHNAEEAANAAKKADKIIIKRVRPWVKASLAFSALSASYGLAR